MRGREEIDQRPVRDDARCFRLEEKFPAHLARSGQAGGTTQVLSVKRKTWGWLEGRWPQMGGGGRARGEGKYNCDVAMQFSNRGGIDDKGRLKIPVDIRTAVGSDSPLVAVLDGDSIRIYRNEEWERVRGELPSVQLESKTSIDSDGRLQLPRELRNVLGTEKKVWLLVRGDHFEIATKDRLAELRRMNLEHDEV